MVETGFVKEANVVFGWAPRDRRPSWIQLEADGRVLDSHATGKWLQRFDPSLRATWEELELSKVNWELRARHGHFGCGQAWDSDQERTPNPEALESEFAEAHCADRSLSAPLGS
jgi:hypothetical protein